LPERLPVLPGGLRAPIPGSIAALELRGAVARRTLAHTPSTGALVAVPLGRACRARRAVLCGVLRRRSAEGGKEIVVVQGLARVALEASQRSAGIVTARARPLVVRGRRARALGRVWEELQRLLRLLAHQEPARAARLRAIADHPDVAVAADLAAGELRLGGRELERFLRCDELAARAQTVARGLRAELMRAQAMRQLEPAGGEPANPQARELAALEARASEAKLPPLAWREANRALEHLRRLPPASSEAARERDWLEWMLELPWHAPVEPAGPARARFGRVVRRLDSSHQGLAEIKARIAEFLAVRRLGGRGRGSALCFVGPPGTGKTSMARAVAEALGRVFIEIPLRGAAEERELRGVPSRMEDGEPGLILAGLARERSRDAVILLDEIDMVDGAATAALAQILDPDEHAAFVDRYLGVPFDLSRCLFVATATDISGIAEPLLDRLELIEFTSYTEAEKLAIAREHLLPGARAACGLAPAHLRVGRGALRSLVRGYTEEAGVRGLARVLDALARKAAIEVVRGREGLSVGRRDLARLLGPAKADEELHRRRPTVGVATALAWTPAGGAPLTVEAILMPGAGRTLLTGHLGDVMRESVQTAISYVRTRLDSFGIEAALMDQIDLHLHFPSGGTPKDGPSAGVAIASALVSLLTRRPTRHLVAMTGELSLRGDVLPVGGVRDKLLAAARSGYTEVIAPSRNAAEVLKLPPEIRRSVRVHLIDHVEQAFDVALAERRSASAHAALPRAGRAARRRRA
jgi:ATP-dependent Lon protease